MIACPLALISAYEVCRVKIIEGVALVEGGARKERLEFPGGVIPRPAPPGPPPGLAFGEEVRLEIRLGAIVKGGRSWYSVGLWPSWNLRARDTQ